MNVLAYAWENLPGLLAVSIASIFILSYVWGGSRRVKSRGATAKAVLITDCQSPVGWELAKRLDKLGFYVFAGFLNAGSEEAKRLCSRCTNKLKAIDIDASKPHTMQETIKSVTGNIPEETGGLYCLVNTRLALLRGDFDWYTPPMCQNIVDTNLTGNILILKSFLPLLKLGKGKVITVCSDYGRYEYPRMSLFTSLNAALIAFYQCLYYELAELDIQVCLVEDRTLTTDGRTDFRTQMKEMWDGMTEKEKTLYSFTFNQFREKSENMDRNNYKRSKEQLKFLLCSVEDAVLNENPRFCYRVFPSTFKMRIMNAIRFFPQKLKHQIVRFLFYRKPDHERNL